MSEAGSLCGQVCRSFCWILFGGVYVPIRNNVDTNNNTNNNGNTNGGYVTLNIVGDDGQTQCVQTDMGTLLRYLKTQDDRTEEEERKWRTEGGQELVMERRCSLVFPPDLWRRLKESPSHKSYAPRIMSAVEGYKRNNVSFVQLLAVFDRAFNQDHGIDRELMSLLPMEEFVRMARAKELVETDGCNALHWVVCRGGDSITAADVEAILAAWPDIVQQTDPKGRLPIHVAALALGGHQPNIPALRHIIQAYPRGLERADHQGLLPLHCAVGNNSPRSDVETIRVLTEANPDAVMIQDRNGFTPLHIAMVKAKADERIFHLFMEHANPEELLQKQDVKGYIPLHLALVINPDRLGLIRALISAWPDGVKHADHDSQTALHFAVMGRRSNLECVRLIHEQWPEAMDRRSAGAMTPLHVAIKAGASMEIVSYLLDNGPASLYSATCPGNETLLHFLMRNPNTDVEVTRRVYEKFPSAIRRRNPDGVLPLHLALPMGSSQDVVEFLLEQWRASVKERTVNGLTALHCAVMVRKSSKSQPTATNNVGNTENDPVNTSPMHDAAAAAAIPTNSPLDNDPLADQDGSERGLNEFAGRGGNETDQNRPEMTVNTDIVRLIHRRWPDALQARSNIGLTPLFDALLSGAPYDAVEYMISEYPQALTIPYPNQFTPLHAAVLGDAPVEVLELLLRPSRVGRDAAVWKRCCAGRTPLHWALMAGKDSGPRFETIDTLIRLHPMACKEKVTSGSRDTPLHIALGARADVAVVRLLVEKWPAGRMVRNSHGLLPIHYTPLYGRDVRPELKRILSCRGVSRSSLGSSRNSAARSK